MKRLELERMCSSQPVSKVLQQWKTVLRLRVHLRVRETSLREDIVTQCLKTWFLLFRKRLGHEFQ